MADEIKDVKNDELLKQILIEFQKLTKYLEQMTGINK